MGDRLYLLAVIGGFALSFTCLLIAMQDLYGRGVCDMDGYGVVGSVALGVIFIKKITHF